MIFKMTREKLNAFKKTLKKIFFFLDDVENENILKKHIFLDFLCFSLFLEFFENI